MTRNRKRFAENDRTRTQGGERVEQKRGIDKCGQMHKPEWTSGRAANQTHKLSLDIGKDGDHAVDPVDTASTAASA